MVKRGAGGGATQHHRQEQQHQEQEDEEGRTRKERSLSEEEKMERIVTLCKKLEEVGLELKKRGYDKEYVPTSYYNHCKAIVNYIEGFARERKVKPTNLYAIQIRENKRMPVLNHQQEQGSDRSSNTTHSGNNNKIRRGHRRQSA